jgi:hypothetical protein
MKLQSNLTKGYYFPIVEGSNIGIINTLKGATNAFLNYIPKKGSSKIIKIASYEQKWSVWANLPVFKRFGYVTDLVAPKMLKDLVKMNKYLNRQYKRMSKHLEAREFEKYLKLIELLSKRSKLFNLVFIIRKIPGWAIDYSPLKVKWLLEKIMRMNQKEAKDLKVVRQFLKEYNLDGTIKKHRPLGVPSREWRVLSSQMEFTLVNFVKYTKKGWNSNQFACMPKVGAGDAWIKIFKALLNTEGKGPIKNIIGYDLKQFFDTVSSLNIKNHLLLDKMPRRFVERLYQINSVPAKIFTRDGEILEDERLANIRIGSVYREFYRMFGLFEGRRESFKIYGLPQGLNTSPFLACYLLDREGFYPKGRHVETPQYVDDGLYMSRTGVKWTNSGFKKMAQTMDISNGLEFNTKKEETIMVQGQWIKPLKFLGCEFNGTTFIARTRNGGKFVVTDADKRLAEILGWLIKHKDLVGVYKQSFNKYIAEGWNREKRIFSSEVINLSDGSLMEKPLDLWMSTKSTIEEITPNCVEFRNVKNLERNRSPLVKSVNTMSMANAHFIAAFVNSPRMQAEERTRRKAQPSESFNILDVIKHQLNW